MDRTGTENELVMLVLEVELNIGKYMKGYREDTAETQKIIPLNRSSLSSTCLRFIVLQNKNPPICVAWLHHNNWVVGKKLLSGFDCIFNFPSCMCLGSSWKASALDIICWLWFKTQEQFRPFGLFVFSSFALSNSGSENKLSVEWVHATYFAIKVLLSSQDDC